MQIKTGFNFLCFRLEQGRIAEDVEISSQVSIFLKGEPSGFVDGLDVASKRKKESRITLDVFSLST